VARQPPGLAQAIESTRPRVCFFGQHHRRVGAEVAGVRCIGLNIVGRPGNLVAGSVITGEHRSRAASP